MMVTVISDRVVWWCRFTAPSAKSVLQSHNLLKCFIPLAAYFQILSHCFWLSASLFQDIIFLLANLLISLYWLDILLFLTTQLSHYFKIHILAYSLFQDIISLFWLSDVLFLTKSLLQDDTSLFLTWHLIILS